MKNLHTFPSCWNQMEKADWNCTGLCLVSLNCPGRYPSQSQALAPAPLALQLSSTGGQELQQPKGVLSCDEQNQLRPRVAPQRVGTVHKALKEVAHEKLYVTLTCVRTAAATPWLTLKTHDRTSCPSATRSGLRVAVRESGEHTVRGHRTRSDPTSGLLLQPRGTCAHHGWSGAGHWSQEKQWLTSALILAPLPASIFSPTSY